jgi:3-dehydroquinate synthetase
MEITYQNQESKTQIVYGETVASMMRKKDLENKQILFCGNQRYYDLFAEKLRQFIPETSTHDWFITPNNRYCNTMENFQELISFLNRFSRQKETLFIGIGNEGVVELLGFTHHVTNFKGELFFLPVSLRSFAQSLSFIDQVVSNKTMMTIMEIEEVPQSILYDHTLTDQQTTGKMVDLLTLIRCGIVCDYSFLQSLYLNFSTREALLQDSFSAFSETLINYYQENSEQLLGFGKTFEKAFFQTENGSLLSNSMKTMFGLLFELAWNVIASDLHFNFKNFMIWLVRLGFPIIVPEGISLADYGQQVIALAKEKPLAGLIQVGEVGMKKVPTQKELLQTFEIYQKIVTEIRGE